MENLIFFVGFITVRLMEDWEGFFLQIGKTCLVAFHDVYK